MSVGTEVVTAAGARGVIVALYSSGIALVLDDVTCKSTWYRLTDLRRAS